MMVGRPQGQPHHHGADAFLAASTGRSLTVSRRQYQPQRRDAAGRPSWRRRGDPPETRLFDVGYHQPSPSSSSSSTVDEKLRGDIPSSPARAGGPATAAPLVVTKGVTATPQHDAVPSDDGYDEDDVPQPTANGGFSHTARSRAKISAANRGRTPWNKGKARPEEVRARIAAGVRARNRERFLEKLVSLGLTEDEYDAQKGEARRRRDADRRARRTAKGGYRPTDETRAKISAVLKQKHARGEIRRAAVHPSKVRRGFTHSEETRKKISDSLKRRWATDQDYREHIMRAQSMANSSPEMRGKISRTLKERWQDPEFRETMLQKMGPRRDGTDATAADGKSHREKISEAMKRKWQDETYRSKTVRSIQRAAENRPKAEARARPKRPAGGGLSPGGGISVTGGSGDSSIPGGVHMIEPMTKQDMARRRVEKVKQKRAAKRAAIVAVEVAIKESRKQTTFLDEDEDGDYDDADPDKSDGPPGGRSVSSGGATAKGLKPERGTTEPNTAAIPRGGAGDLDPRPPSSSSAAKTAKEPDGSVSRLKEERRDLFDLLYGDEEAPPADGDDGDDQDQDEVADYAAFVPRNKMRKMRFGDEDLDAFDPYGLDDY